MFGNIINNSQLIEMIKGGSIIIDPFDRTKLKNIHYPLKPYSILQPMGRERDGSYRTKMIHHFDGHESTYKFSANEYLIVEVDEFISITEGVVGQFIPPSNFVFQGFGLTAGRLEAPFGRVDGGRQKVRFGVKNLLDTENILFAEDYIAYVYFIDLKGLKSEPLVLSERDRDMFASWLRRKRQAEDDGPRYDP